MNVPIPIPIIPNVIPHIAAPTEDRVNLAPHPLPPPPPDTPTPHRTHPTKTTTKTKTKTFATSYRPCAKTPTTSNSKSDPSTPSGSRPTKRTTPRP
mmetsp:Transcript_22685/g.48065  ORF Transcript_22685/g.48065 Transcript_22685/m.48065 type:complete len:96 (-) Transcript_22685:852-1139(-)